MKKIVQTGIGVISTIMLISVAAPARANPIIDFLNDATRGLENAARFYESLVDEIDSIGADNDIVIQNVHGDLELPDLEKIEASIEEQLDNKDSLSKVDSILTYVESEAIKSHSNSILGTEGQKADAQSIQIVDDAVAAVAAIEAQGNGRGVSQEVLKDLLKQQTQMAGINSSLNKELIELKQTTAYNNRAVAKSIEQQQNAALEREQRNRGTMVTEIAVAELLKANLYGSKRCGAGQETVFVTQENGVSIPPRKECR